MLLPRVSQVRQPTVKTIKFRMYRENLMTLVPFRTDCQDHQVSHIQRNLMPLVPCRTACQGTQVSHVQREFDALGFVPN